MLRIGTRINTDRGAFGATRINTDKNNIRVNPCGERSERNPSVISVNQCAAAEQRHSGERVSNTLEPTPEMGITHRKMG